MSLVLILFVLVLVRVRLEAKVDVGGPERLAGGVVEDIGARPRRQ